MSKDYKAEKAVAALIAKVATANERGVLDATNCVHHLLSVIEAVADGVLVIAPDIGDEQRREIRRELAVMRLLARQCQDELGLEHFSGSCHLQREGKVS